MSAAPSTSAAAGEVEPQAPPPPQVFHCQKLPGWVKPDEVIYVARPNSHIPPAIKNRCHQFANPFANPGRTRSEKIRAFQLYLKGCPSLVAEAKRLLKGKHLCCWCDPPLPCHARILLEIVNAPDPPKKDGD